MREKVALLQAADGDPEVLRQAYQALYLENVSKEQLAASTLAMEMTVQAKKSGAGATVVRNGETLKTGDELVFGVRVSQSAHVYVFQKKEGGSLDVLFPNPAISKLSNPIPAAQVVRIPPQGQVFTLDDQDLGTEQVYVVVSKGPLTSLESALASANSGDEGSEEKVGSAMGDLFTEAAPECADRTRGLTVEEESGCGSMTRGLTPKKSEGDDFFADESTMSARTNPGDDVILRTFSFIHQ